MKTAIITTDSYSNHNTGQGHPENADRVSVVIDNLKKKQESFIWEKPKEFESKYLKITHNPNYINEVKTACLWKKKSSKFEPDFCPVRLTSDPWIVQPTEHYEELSIDEILKKNE